MKAKYILEAIDAMRNAKNVLNNRDALMQERWAAGDTLDEAWINLKVYSGINDVKVEVEETA